MWVRATVRVPTAGEMNWGEGDGCDDAFGGSWAGLWCGSCLPLLRAPRTPVWGQATLVSLHPLLLLLSEILASTERIAGSMTPHDPHGEWFHLLEAAHSKGPCRAVLGSRCDQQAVSHPGPWGAMLAGSSGVRQGSSWSWLRWRKRTPFREDVGS